MRSLQVIYQRLRPLLFLLSPETAHAVTLKLLKWIYRPAVVKKIQAKNPSSPVQVFGLTFPNRVGLSAGLDKNGDYIDALFGLGFGFIEVGAVTPKPQPGNPKPRLFRLPKEKALINRLGFNNLGVDYLVENLKKRKISGIVGVNLGKNFTTPIELAYQDYEIGYEKVFPYADYVTINISSPNTPQLRQLQNENYLHDLLSKLKSKQLELERQYRRQVPLLLKISPDLTTEEIKQIAEVALAERIDGVVAVNTTSDRRAVYGLPHAEETGGLSGAPLFQMTIRVIKTLRETLGDQIPIIGVGGIMSATQAQQVLKAGAKLIQIYTGLIYEGPGLVQALL